MGVSKNKITGRGCRADSEMPTLPSNASDQNIHRRTEDGRQSECVKTDFADSRVIHTVHTKAGSERLTEVYIKLTQDVLGWK